MQKVLDHLRTSQDKLHELNELRQWYKEEEKLESILKDLVSSHKLEHKVLKQGDIELNLYWLPQKDESTPAAVQPLSTPTSSNKRQLGGGRMSVKRSQSKFTSPFLAKRQRNSDGLAQKLNFSGERTESEGLSKEPETENNKKEQLVRKIAEKEEKLRRLKMVQLYKSKHDLAELKRLIVKWREVSQEAAYELFSISNHPDKSLKQLLDCLNIDYSTIHYSIEEDDFY